jgi:arylsulfatase A-like enzyme
LFTSDHGEAFGEHGNINHGSTVYTEEIHVPFVLAGANVPSTGLLPNRVEVVDTARTLLELAGLPANRVDGQNVLSGYQPRVALATMVKRFSVEDTEWKLVASVDYGNAPKVGEYELQMEQLFHISVDPFEKDDLLAKEVEQARRLRSILVDRLKLDLRPSIEERVLSRIEQQQLDALGYAGGDDEH